MSARLWAAVVLAAALAATVVVLAVVSTSAGSSGASQYPVPVASSPDPSDSADPGASASAAPDASATPGAAGLTDDQRRKADVMISTFENSTTAVQYGYAEDLHDGQGVTSGRAGFTTADGDALEVVQEYTAQRPDNPLARFVPTMKQLAAQHSGDTDALPKDEYITAWQQAGPDPAFQKAQDDTLNRLYFQPAMAQAAKVGLRTAIAKVELYDAMVQHGGGSDPDGLPALVQRATDKAGGTPASGVDEGRWLDAFFDVRLDDLQHPDNDALQQGWSQSVDRVNCVRRIAESGNTELTGTVTFTVYGDEFQVD